jgi:hypothetical protein
MIRERELAWKSTSEENVIIKDIILQEKTNE